MNRAAIEPLAVPQKTGSKLVSIILVNYNCRQYVEALSACLQNQTYSHLEILVFDNGSNDGSLEKIKQFFPQARIFELGENTGLSKPNNLGISESRGAYILCLNFDVVLEKTFVEEMVNAIETDKQIGWVAGKMLKLTNGGKSKKIDCLGHHMLKSRYARELDYSKPFTWNDYAKRQFVFGASACAALYRKEMLHDIALNGEYFDEDFFAYFEDVDLDWRAQHRNWKCLYTPQAIGYHVRYGTNLIKNKQIAAYYLSNRIFMMIKNDDWKHCMRDIVPISLQFIRDFITYTVMNPRALALALSRIVRLYPKMCTKRVRIFATRKTSRNYMRSLIR